MMQLSEVMCRRCSMSAAEHGVYHGTAPAVAQQGEFDGVHLVGFYCPAPEMTVALKRLAASAAVEKVGKRLIDECAALNPTQLHALGIALTIISEDIAVLEAAAEVDARIADEWDGNESLREFSDTVVAWHKDRFPPRDVTLAWSHEHALYEGVNMILGIGKVCEEAGEFFGAVVKAIEGRPGITEVELQQKVWDELGDVIISACGALRRANDLLGTDRNLADVVYERWASVKFRSYNGDEAQS